MHPENPNRRFRARAQRWGALLVAALLFGSLAWAVDRDHVIAWLPPAGTVDGYKVYVGTQSNQYAQALDIGLVAPDPDGKARATLRLDSATDFYVAMTAYNTAGESARSNEIVVPADACDPTACGDGNSCTADTCEITGCAHTAIPDGTACNLNGSFGLCSGGACQAAQCLADADCSDGNLCNGVESCVLGGSCAPGTALTCGTATECAAPGCDPAVGCVMTPVADGTPCGGSARWRVGSCQAGVCVTTIDASKPGKGGRK